ncbi:hypothetical protein [uncultured Desulfovibrio sp.]|uniref:hypothetical protein n=1 Tax=uncultured Desulfovibrio sp. TaxID=167968 RepID=UPI00262DCD27|nr:hypothetical protein [uncultured Desulfovibrio sp.]
MCAKMQGIYFDKQDRDILALVNRILESDGKQSDTFLFDPSLHPHGIKELVASPVSRMAYAVINLLRNLQAGRTQARDRLLALKTLYDEVLNSAHSALRRNTARALMQIMKSMVRAHGSQLEQLKLAHDFRRTVQGTPRVVRRMLARYHLPEMPESWNQLAFDDHVYDANTKGRKTPTHLIMDAWIKGMRSLTVAYEYWVQPDAAREILRAAEITGIGVRIGLEFHMPFYGRFISLFWIPRGFSSNEDFLEFLHSPKVAELMKRGREVLRWRRERVLESLALWNEIQRPQLEAQWGVTVPELTGEGFSRHVGRGQASGLHLAEALHAHVQPSLRERAALLRESDSEEARAELVFLDNLSAEYIADHWLSPLEHPEMPDLNKPCAHGDLPPLMQLSVGDITRELSELNPGYRLVLTTKGLSVEDVAELLWDSRGSISHLEIFNMRGWMEGKHSCLKAISELQQALNEGLGPRVKQMIRTMVRRMSTQDEERAAKFRHILHNVPKLWEHYRNKPLGSRLGTSSVSRDSYGMGFVLRETLPARSRKFYARDQKQPDIPVCSPVEECVRYSKPRNPSPWQKALRLLRHLPGCRHMGMERQSVWKTASVDFRICTKGNVLNLGGLSLACGNGLLDKNCEKGSSEPLGPAYLNSFVSNCLKVLMGFCPAFFSFMYTQNWWFLAWCGTFIWFGITGFRNVVQMVMAAKGATRSTLIHWKDQVNVSRLCDSLMFTGFSVLLLEMLVRVLLLDKTLGITAAQNPWVVFGVLSLVNGIYLCAHNVFRGFPKEASIGNLFRSLLAIPVSSLYNWVLYQVAFLLGVDNPAMYLVPSAAVISKMASDSVAALIEGYADSQVNLRMRRWDYRSKLASVFDCYTRLELLFPDEDALIKLAKPGGLQGSGGVMGKELERAFIINALDLMYIWFYQPRAQDAFRQIARAMPEADRNVLARAQLVLTREREVSQMLVDGLLGRNFSRPLAFYLDKRKEYLRRLSRLCRPGKMREPGTF